MSNEGSLDKASRILGKLPRRLIFVITLIVLIWPLFYPWKLPVSISPDVQTMFTDMTALEGTGEAILLLHFAPPVFWGEMQHLTYAVIQHVFMMEDVKLVVGALTAMSQPLINSAIETSLENTPLTKEYGVDYCTLPFFPGPPSVVPSAFGLLAENFRGAYTIDDRGNPIDTLSVLDGINSLDDFSAIIWIEPAKWQPLIAQILYPRHPTLRYYYIAIAEGFNYIAPYLGTVYRAGLIGVRPAAEYQTLYLEPQFYSGAVAQMDAISGYHIFAIVPLFFGNLTVVIEKLRKSGAT